MVGGFLFPFFSFLRDGDMEGRGRETKESMNYAGKCRLEDILENRTRSILHWPMHAFQDKRQSRLGSALHHLPD